MLNGIQMAVSRLFFVKIVFWATLFVCSGCGGGPDWAGSGGDETVVSLDEDMEYSVELAQGEQVLFEMRNPGDGGYEFAGASFDAAILRLDNFVLQPPEQGAALGDFGRAAYVFTALEFGETVVRINIRRPGTESSEIYKQVNIKVVY